MQKIILVLLFPLLFACSEKSDCERAPNVSNIPVSINIKRNERELFQKNDKNQIINFIKTNNDLAENFLQASDFANDTVLAEQLLKIVTDENIKVLYKETQEEFSDINYLTEQFVQAFKFAKYYFPNFQAPEIHTMVTGLGNDLFVSSNQIIIGLDFFIGDKATYRPVDFPQYILNRYRKEYIVPSSILLMSSNFNATERNDNSVLADMIFYGKAYYFTKKMLPCTPDSLIIGYTSEEIENVEKNQGTIWAHFVDKQLIYETNPFIKSRYLDERPKTPEVGNKAPGRLGNFLGWKIVQKYMKENPEVTLSQLMQTKDAQLILNNSKYKPQNNSD